MKVDELFPLGAPNREENEIQQSKLRQARKIDQQQCPKTNIMRRNKKKGGSRNGAR